MSVDWLAQNEAALRMAVEALRARAGGAAALPAPPPPALLMLAERFALTPFERDVVLYCAAAALDGALYEAAPPSVGACLRLLEGGSLSAFTPAAPLRRWQLVLIGDEPTFLARTLRISERVLHHLLGLAYVDTQLAGLARAAPDPGALLPSAEALCQQVMALLSDPERPVVQIGGPNGEGALAVAAAALSRLELDPRVIRAAELPELPQDREALLTLWQREAVLAERGLILDATGLEPAQFERKVGPLLEALQLHALVLGAGPLLVRGRPVVRLSCPWPDPVELAPLWEEALGDVDETGVVQTVVAQFRLSPSDLRAVASEVRAAAPPDPGDALWEACRRRTRPALEGLATRVESAAGWSELVVGPRVMMALQQIALTARTQETLRRNWGFNGRGTGLACLFAGPSGTGKTLAAEVLANELRLDLVRVELGAVVSKWLGETEKNLDRIFNAAEAGGAVLLFDEADALFGKRNSVSSSQDRYANLEVSFLLQRMEAWRGLAILTTNLREDLDAAFLRRLRFTVAFGFPDPAQRAELWRRVFPAKTPTLNLDFERLARLDLSGGAIHNAALTAAHLAAHERSAVTMAHVARGVQLEMQKLERPMPPIDLGGAPSPL